MKRFFSRNIDRTGRILRAIWALGLAVGAVFAFRSGIVWLGVTLVAGALFALFEALRGWCALRACGIKTKF
jgi:hypothetical protein